jgi:signal transduction histidine kinase
MDFHEIIKILVSLVGIILSLFLILYSLSKAKRNSLLVWYISLQALILLWSLISFMETFFSQPISWRLLQIKYFSICLIGLFWLLFCFELTNKKIAVKAKLLLSIPPVVSYLFMITTKYHNLFYDFNGKRSFGILFWINTIEVYIYTLIGTFFLIKYFFRDKKQTRFQSVIFVQASIIPLVANFVYLCFRFKIDITPLSFVISLLLLLLANTKYRFLNIYPIALNSVVGSMKEGFFVIDSYNNIVNYNISFMNEIGYRANIRPDCSVDGLMEFFKNNVSEEKDYLVLYDAIKNVTRETVKGKLTLDKPINKTYQVIVQPVLSKNCNIVGRLVTFSDVSLYMNLLKELHNKNSDLLLANEQLKEYSQASQKLAIADERNRISMELHDILLKFH